MEPTAAIRLAEQQLITGILESRNSPESQAAEVARFHSTFTPHFFFKVSETYQPRIARTIITNFLPFLGQKHAPLTTAVLRFFQFFGSVLTGIAPDKFIRIIRKLSNDSTLSNFLSVFLPALGTAAASLPESARLSYFPFFRRFVSRLTPDQSGSVPWPLWELLIQYGSVSDLAALIEQAVGPATLASIAPLIGRQKPQLIAQLFVPFSLEHRIQFLRLAKRSPPLIAAIADYGPVHADPGNPDYPRVYQLYAYALKAREALTDAERLFFAPIAERALAQIPGLSGVPKASLLKFLCRALRHGIGTAKALLAFVDFAVFAGVSVSVALAAPAEALADDAVRAGLLETAASHSTHLFVRIARRLDFARLSAADADFAVAFVRQLLHPFPVMPEAISAALDLVNRLPASVVPRLGLDPSKVFLQLYASPRPSVIAGLKQFTARFDLEVNPVAVDLTGDAAALAFQHLPRLPAPLTEELLASGLVPPAALSFLIPHLQPSRPVFFNLIALLELLVLEFGIDLTELYQSFGIPPEEIGVEHPWIDRVNVHGLFRAVRGNFFATPFGRLLRSTIEGITATYQFEFKPTDVLHKLALLLSFIAHMYTEPVVSLVLLLYSDCVGRNRPRVFALVLENAIERIWRHDLPIASAPSLLRLAILVDGIAGVVKAHRGLVAPAAALDRDLARQLADKLPKPLPPIPTFLSFVGLPQFAEYVDICQTVIPPEEWVLLPGDASLLAMLPKSAATEAIHAVVLQRLSARSIVGGSEKIPAGERLFTFEAPVVREVGVAVRATEPRTLANLRGFLWYTGQPLPPELTPEALEQIAIANAGDSRLLIAYFAWASTAHIEIDVAAWAARIASADFDDLTAVLVASLLAHARAPLPPALMRLLESAYAIFRLPFTDTSTLRLLRTQHGPGFLLARNVVRADPARWTATAPLPASAALRDLSLFSAHLTSPDLPALLSAAAELLLEPTQQELLPADLLFPPAYAPPPQLQFFLPDPPLPAPRAIPASVLDGLLSNLAPRAPLPPSWFHFFARVSLDPLNLPRARAIFAFDGDGLHHLYPTLYPLAVADDEACHFLHRNPPSYSRAFIRARGCALLPPARLSPDAARAVAGALRPVFPGLAYAHGATSGVRAHSVATPLSALRYGIYAPAFGRGLLRTLESRSLEALAVCAGLLELPVELLRTAVPHVTREMAREEVMKRLLESATGGEASVAFARAAIDCIIATAAAQQVMVIVGNAEFLTRPGFACVVAVFRAFRAWVERDGPPDVAEWCRVLVTEEAAVFPDEFRRRIFASLGDPASIASALHGGAP
jgi:hypothetical protein